jgi:hypothetical protein
MVMENTPPINDAKERLKAKAIELVIASKFTFRSCWECNSGHAHWKNDKDDKLINCFGCGRWCMNGEFIELYPSDFKPKV